MRTFRKIIPGQLSGRVEPQEKLITTEIRMCSIEIFRLSEAIICCHRLDAISYVIKCWIIL